MTLACLNLKPLTPLLSSSIFLSLFIHLTNTYWTPTMRQAQRQALVSLLLLVPLPVCSPRTSQRDGLKVWPCQAPKSSLYSRNKSWIFTRACKEGLCNLLAARFPSTIIHPSARGPLHACLTGPLSVLDSAWAGTLSPSYSRGSFSSLPICQRKCLFFMRPSQASLSQ